MKQKSLDTLNVFIRQPYWQGLHDWIAAKVALWQIQLAATLPERAFVNQVFPSPFNFFFHSDYFCVISAKQCRPKSTKLKIYGNITNVISI